MTLFIYGLSHLTEDEIVRISTTVRATAKSFTPLCSPSGSDDQKNSDFVHFQVLQCLFEGKDSILQCHNL